MSGAERVYTLLLCCMLHALSQKARPKTRLLFCLIVKGSPEQIKQLLEARTFHLLDFKQQKLVTNRIKKKTFFCFYARARKASAVITRCLLEKYEERSLLEVLHVRLACARVLQVSSLELTL